MLTFSPYTQLMFFFLKKLVHGENIMALVYKKLYLKIMVMGFALLFWVFTNSVSIIRFSAGMNAVFRAPGIFVGSGQALIK